jgi:excisionase family DNA binding protein
MAHEQQESKGKEDQMDKQVQNATLSVDEAHVLIGKDNISRGGFYAALNRGEVPNVRLGKRILIPRHAFERWLESAGGAAA